MLHWTGRSITCFGGDGWAGTYDVSCIWYNWSLWEWHLIKFRKKNIHAYKLMWWRELRGTQVRSVMTSVEMALNNLFDYMNNVYKFLMIFRKYHLFWIIFDKLESALIIEMKRAKGIKRKKCNHYIRLCLTTEPQESAFRVKAGAINYLIDGSLAFVDGGKHQIRCPFEEDLFRKELDREIQLKWNPPRTKSLLDWIWGFRLPLPPYRTLTR